MKSGFNQQTLLTLKEIASNKQKEGQQLYLTLCFDEMAIRRHIQWVHGRKEFSGLVNYGRRDDDNVPLANYAIFFLINLIGFDHALILGYFLIKSLDKTEKANLIRDAIIQINSTSSVLLTIAFDGLATNLAACEVLGASFDVNILKPYILNPENNNRICIVLDPPHMLKLVRNCLGAKNYIVDGNNNIISWMHFVNLLGKKSDLVAHRITREHIEFESNKMKVRLAAQVFSLSAARSMEILMRNRDPSFIEATGTIIFTKNFNKAFDIFNSKHPDSTNKFKRGLNTPNADEIFEFLDYFCGYIKQLKVGGCDILKSERKTGFLGFLINTTTLKFLYEEYVKKQKIINILFYYLGQDSLECLFSRVRYKLGSNDNPTAEQLSGVVRQLIAFNELSAPKTASCEDNLNLLHVSSTCKPKTNEIFPAENIENQDNSIPNFILNFRDLYTIKLRAGTIEKKVNSSDFRCLDNACRNIFRNNNEQIDGIFFENNLIQKPTKSTVKICEIIYKFFMANENIFDFNFSIFYQKIIMAIPFENVYTNINFSHNKDHKAQIILLIIDEYIRIHATYWAKTATIQAKEKIIGNASKKLRQNLGQ